MDVADFIFTFKELLDTRGKSKTKQAFRDAGPNLIEIIISDLVSRDRFEIGIQYKVDSKGNEVSASLVTMDQYEEEKLSLLLYSKNKLALEINFWGFDDEEHLFRYSLTKEDLGIVPEGLINLMHIVLKKDEPQSVSPNQLRH